jgi:hypothetical protein
MRQYDFHIRKIDRDIIDQYWLSPFQAQAATAAHTGSHARMASVENRRQAVFGNYFIQWIRNAVRRVAILHDTVKFKSLYAVILNQITRLFCADFALVRIDRSEWDNDIQIVGGIFGYLIIAHPLCAQSTFSIDSKLAKRDVTLAVKGNGSGIVGRLRSALKMGAGGIKEFAHHQVFGIVAGHFSMNVHIYSGDIGNIDHVAKSSVSIVGNIAPE